MIMHTCHKCYVLNYNAAMVGIAETQYCANHGPQDDNPQED